MVVCCQFLTDIKERLAMGSVEVAGLDRVLMRLGMTEESDLEKVLSLT